MKHVVFRVLLMLALAVVTVAVAQQPDDDDVVLTFESSTTTRLARKAKIGRTGSTLYDAQEGAHDGVTAATGEEIDHYYVWLCFGDECIPVDPIRFSN